MARKSRISKAFGAAARYDDEALVQREVAEGLAERIGTLSLPSAANMLEIGCGTGFLTAALRARGVTGRWIVSDLSEAMVSRCREAQDDPAIAYLVMDGERPCFAEGAGFDLICSSLAFQWFDDLPAAIARLMGLLRPGGRLAFTTMADHSFDEWRQAHLACGLEPATPDYPPLAVIAASAPEGVGVDCTERFRKVGFADAGAFLRHLRGIGAHVPRPGSRPLTPGALRRVMRRFEDDGAVATYHVACCTFSRPA